MSQKQSLLGGRRALAVLCGAAASLGSGALLWVLTAARPLAGAEGPGPASAPATRPADTAPASQPAAETEEEQRHRLLAAREKKTGPTFPGTDPAFLVLPRPAYRSHMVKELLTPNVRRMTEEALDFLARTQDADGGWSETEFPANTGVTALVSLAFMAQGSRPRAGRYGKALDRGLEFLLKNVQSNGTIANKGSNRLGPGYEHAYSTLALLNAYGDMPWRPQTQDVLARAIQLLGRSQHRDGGWRYQMNREGLSDLSVTANVLWVLRQAKKGGFTVSQKMIDAGVQFIEQCANPDGTFRYIQGGIHTSPSLGGTGLIALCNNGNIDHRLIPNARNRIEYEYRRYTVDDLKDRRYFVYGCFYASLAMYMCGDRYWIPWFKKAVKVLQAIQRKDGEFTDQRGNRIYPTAMAAMILQAPLGYLPVYER
jgi:hypothetical protein